MVVTPAMNSLWRYPESLHPSTATLYWQGAKAGWTETDRWWEWKWQQGRLPALVVRREEGGAVGQWLRDGSRQVGLDLGKNESAQQALPPQVNVLHSMNRVAHPSHVLSSQQFLHRGHQPPPEMAGHSLVSSHRNSSMYGFVGPGGAVGWQGT